MGKEKRLHATFVLLGINCIALLFVWKRDRGENETQKEPIKVMEVQVHIYQPSKIFIIIYLKWVNFDFESYSKLKNSKQNKLNVTCFMQVPFFNYGFRSMLIHITIFDLEAQKSSLFKNWALGIEQPITVCIVPHK